ncbi:MAG: 3-deoxy-7-phosphoheptulonate synthase, partial [Clostridia bacterium]|nr:3-deoxy-7-phosphoheptulonate synthase [Clostridia bacterium]
MVVIIKHGVSQEKLNNFIVDIKAQGPDIHIVEGAHTTILGLVGDTSRIDINLINQIDIVDSVRRISEPFKVVNRKFHPENSIITVDGKVRVGEKFAVIAGPCSVESEEQIIEVAERVKKAGATMLRGGAFKPRTSPYAFRGLKSDGIELLLEAKKVTGLPIVTELTSLSNIDLFNDVDVIQVGARNMQNFDMLSELGKCDKPIL